MAEGGMSQQTPVDLQHELNRLKAQFDERMPAVFDQVAGFAKPADTPEELRSRLEGLARLMHTLAGSAGTFGRPKLGQAARQLEQTFAEALAGHECIESMEGMLKAAYEEDLAELAPMAGSQTASPVEPRRGSRPVIPEIWLLEDEPLLGESLQAQLRAFNFQTRLFDRFNDLVDALRVEEPEVIVLDMVLEEEGGSADLFRSAGFTVPLTSSFMVISASDDFSLRHSASRLGAEAYFLKPLDIPRLISRIEQVISRRHAPPERVLIVDDDDLLAEHYQSLLKSGGMVTRKLDALDQVVEVLETFKPDIVLLDLQMPGLSGQELAGIIRQYDRWFSLPIVFLSSEHRFDVQMDAMRQGGDDFIVKSVSDDELIGLVRAKVFRARQLQELMTKDSLTGLLKHTTVKDAIDSAIARNLRSGGTLCVAMLDIDHFKSVNDRYGHAAGDEVIESVATLLRQRLRSTDIIGRYGGEEFAVALPDCAPEEAEAILNAFRESLYGLSFVSGDHSFSVTISGGFTCCADRRGDDSRGTADELLAMADKALYEAKQRGRNRVVRFSGA